MGWRSIKLGFHSVCTWSPWPYAVCKIQVIIICVIWSKCVIWTWVGFVAVNEAVEHEQSCRLSRTSLLGYHIGYRAILLCYSPVPVAVRNYLSGCLCTAFIFFFIYFFPFPPNRGVLDSIVGWATMLRAGRSPVRIPDEVEFFNLPITSSRIMALGSTQPLTEMSTRNVPGDKKLTTLPPSMSRMSENVGASTSRNPKGLHGLYGDNFIIVNFCVQQNHHPSEEFLWMTRWVGLRRLCIKRPPSISFCSTVLWNHVTTWVMNAGSWVYLVCNSSDMLFPRITTAFEEKIVMYCVSGVEFTRWSPSFKVVQTKFIA
jgi:hypothetical protein